MLVAVVPTDTWNMLYDTCRKSPVPVRATSRVFLQAQLGWAIDLISVEHREHRDLGMLFPERWNGHTREDVLQAVEAGDLDASVLNHGSLLNGEDTVLVYFEPIEEAELSLEEQWMHIQPVARRVFHDHRSISDMPPAPRSSGHGEASRRGSC